MSPRERKNITVTERMVRGFMPAVKSGALYMLAGLLIGTALIAVETHLELNGVLDKNGIWLRLIEHLGIGFLVSAIAVFFYEWGAHLKDVVELSEKLCQTIEERIPQIADEHDQVHFHHSIRSIIFRDGATTDGKADIIVTEIHNLVDAVAVLQNSEGWGCKEHIGFIAAELQGVVNNARSLSRVAQRQAAGLAALMAPEGSGEHHFIVKPDAAIVADAILSSQMRAMSSGDHYDVLSSLPTWRTGRLEEFKRETGEAVMKRQVHVYRIINLLRYQEEQLALGVEETRSILESHLKQMHDWTWKGGGRYEVRVLSKEDANRLDAHERDELAAKHFGIFCHGKDGSDTQRQLRFAVEKSDLSDMRMTSDINRIRDEGDLFKLAWRVAKPLDKEAINRVAASLRAEAPTPAKK
jgi:hypothetical protein